MKKIYMLLTALLIGVAAASAAQPKVKNDYKPLYLTEEGAKLLKSIARTRLDQVDLSKIEIDPSHDVVTTRGYYEQGTNICRWSMSLDRDQRWCDLLFFINDQGEEDHYTFEQFPFYLVWFNMTLQNKADYKPTAYIPQFGFWPCYYYFSQQFEYIGDVPEEERDYRAVLPKDMCNPMDLGGGLKTCAKFQERPMINGGLGVSPEWNSSNGMYDFWCIANQDFMIGVTENDATVMYRGFYGTTQCNEQRASNFTFKSLTEDNVLSMDYKAYPYVMNGTTAKSYPVNIAQFLGQAKINSWELKTVNYPINAVHIFNAGEDSSAELGVTNPYIFANWGPFRRYYMFGFGNDMFDIAYKDASMKVFDSSQLQAAWVDGTTTEDALNPDNQNYFFGALFSDVTSDKPYDYWRVQHPSYQVDDKWGVQLTMMPEAHTTMPAYDLIPDDVLAAENADKSLKHPEPIWIERDALVTYLEGSLELLMPGGYVACGTPEGFVINGTDQYHNTVRGTFTGDIFYHADPNDCQKFDKIPAVGTTGVNETAASKNVISGAQGEILVVLEKTAAVEVYNLNGQQVYSGNAIAGMPLVIELPGGFYVVKAGKETKKVVL